MDPKVGKHVLIIQVLDISQMRQITNSLFTSAGEGVPDDLRRVPGLLKTELLFRKLTFINGLNY